MASDQPLVKYQRASLHRYKRALSTYKQQWDLNGQPGSQVHQTVSLRVAASTPARQIVRAHNSPAECLMCHERVSHQRRQPANVSVCNQTAAHDSIVAICTAKSDVTEALVAPREKCIEHIGLLIDDANVLAGTSK